MKTTVRYPSVLMTAVVAGVFSLVVCALMVADFANRLTKDPLDSPEFLALKKQLEDAKNKRGDQVAGEDIEGKVREIEKGVRSLDLELREKYFREQQFMVTGAYLLLGGIVVALSMGKWAATLRRKLPMPVAKSSGPDSDERLSRFGPAAVAVLMVALIGTVWAMNVSYRSELPATLDELAALLERDKGESEKTTKVVSTRPAIPELPTMEEFRKSWPCFRGPDGSGISKHAAVPTQWDGSSGKGIVWKTPVPLPGLNSPIVWKDRVFLAGATKERREVYCFDAADGKLLWKKEVTSAGEPPKVSKDTGYAAPTTATDGRFVFAMFATGDLVAFNFSGEQQWSLSLGVPQNHYGHAASLAIYKDRVIVLLDQGREKDDLSKLFAFDGASGKKLWEVTRKMPSAWSSPIVVEHKSQPQIITCGDPWVIGYSVSGKEIWRADALEGAEIGPSPVYSGGMVFAVNDYAALSAIRVGGSGNVTDTHVQWSADVGLPDTCSPLVTDEFVLALASFGSLSCFDKKKGGDPLWEEDFETDFVSSPSLVGDRVYLFGKEGKTWIVEPTSKKCKRITEADLGEGCVTSPAFQDGRIYIRGANHLFCIGETK